MILLDTNVLIESIQLAPNANVLAWLDRQLPDTLYLASTTVAELLTEIVLLPDGAGKRRLAEIARGFRSAFAGRILAFDEDAAATYARLWARLSQSGQTISNADGQIAAIAATHKFAVATRDTRPFLAAGVRVINPWEPSES